MYFVELKYNSFLCILIICFSQGSTQLLQSHIEIKGKIRASFEFDCRLHMVKCSKLHNMAI